MTTFRCRAGLPRFLTLLLALWAAGTSPALAGEAATAGYSQVAVEILEGAADNKTWDLAETTVTEWFSQRTFGFVGLPKKYSDKGLILDRASPFVARATATCTLPAGEHRLLLRARGASRLFVDDVLVAETAFRTPNPSGHEKVPPLKSADEPDLRPLPAGHHEAIVRYASDGRPHVFRAEAMLADQKLRPELGEFVVAVAAEGGRFNILAAECDIPLSDAAWKDFAEAGRVRLIAQDAYARRRLTVDERAFWQRRHDAARKHWSERAQDNTVGSDDAAKRNPIDRLLGSDPSGSETGSGPFPLCDDSAFLRRITLDATGLFPTPAEQRAFTRDRRPDRRERVIERLLADGGWADHWVSFWQDLLAENPGILKPELNNTGPFRWWIYESLADNKPLDRFVTELVMMEGSVYGGGPAGFSMATQNDAPLAEKAHTLAKAFLAVDLKCARCHDAPYQPYKQQDTFALAAMLGRKNQTLPKTSTVPVAAGERQPQVPITLKAGASIKPEWPFAAIAPGEIDESLLRDAGDSRERLAAILTSPANERFAQVIVNRLWARLFGAGLVASVDDWHEAKIVHPELLEFLGRELITHDYDLQHVARLIFTSLVYQQSLTTEATAAAPPVKMARRRLSAEQLVDAALAAVGKPLDVEELNLDPEVRRPVHEFLNLGTPRRAWQFASLSNERDRPALSLAKAQGVVDVLTAFGWRESRQNPQSSRDQSPNVLQPLVLANGVLGTRLTRLSDDHAVTRLSVRARELPALVDGVYRQILSRTPTAAERQAFVELLQDGFDDRLREPSSASKPAGDKRNAVSWSNHLSPEASRIKMDLERAARAGEPPTDRLAADWRERMEDMVWALVNSPEFMFVP